MPCVSSRFGARVVPQARGPGERETRRTRWVFSKASRSVTMLSSASATLPPRVSLSAAPPGRNGRKPSISFSASGASAKSCATRLKSVFMQKRKWSAIARFMGHGSPASE